MCGDRATRRHLIQLSLVDSVAGIVSDSKSLSLSSRKYTPSLKLYVVHPPGISLPLLSKSRPRSRRAVVIGSFFSAAVCDWRSTNTRKTIRSFIDRFWIICRSWRAGFPAFLVFASVTVQTEPWISRSQVTKKNPSASHMCSDSSDAPYCSSRLAEKNSQVGTDKMKASSKGHGLENHLKNRSKILPIVPSLGVIETMVMGSFKLKSENLIN